MRIHLIVRLLLSLTLLYATATSINAQPIINFKQWKIENGGNDHWYGVLASTHPWVVHRDTASSFLIDTLPGYLAIITSSTENQFIRDSIVKGIQTDNISNAFYIGAEYQVNGFVWLDGNPFTYRNWGTGEPNGFGSYPSGLGVAIWGSAPGVPGTWNDCPRDTLGISPANQLWSVVEWDGGDTVASSDSLSPLIGLRQWRAQDGGNNHWYAVFPSRQPWVVHRDTAKFFLLDTQPAYLATITRKAENRFVVDSVLKYLYSNLYTNQYYLGLFFDSNGWRWIEEEPQAFLNWAPYQPNFEATLSVGTIAGISAGIPAGTWSDEPGDTTGNGAVHRLWALFEWGPPDSTTDTIPIPQSIRNLRQWRVEDGGNGHWYGVFASNHPWVVHRDTAYSFLVDSLHGYLASITSPNEDYFVRDSIVAGVQPPSYNGQFYLGAYFDDFKFRWLTDEIFGYSSWYPGEPNGEHGTVQDRAIAMMGGRSQIYIGKWNDVPQDTVGTGSFHQTWSVLEWGLIDSSFNIDTLPPIINLKQWSSQQGGNDHWYGLIQKAMPWNSHFQMAYKYRIPYLQTSTTGSLATITSHGENGFILDSILFGVQSENSSNQFFLGLRTEFYFLWDWITEESYRYTNWGVDQPDFPVSNPCVAIAGNDAPYLPGTWNDVTRDTALGSPVTQFWSVIEFDGTCCRGSVGNVNGDWLDLVDIQDLTEFISWYYYGNHSSICLAEADFNGDHKIDFADLASLVDALFSSLASPPQCSY